MKRYLFLTILMITSVGFQAQFFDSPRKTGYLIEDSTEVFAIADFDNDGIMDIARNRVYFLDSKLNIDKDVYFVPNYTERVNTGNFNGDNLTDLVYCSWWNNTLSFKLNTGNQSFINYDKSLR